MLQFLTIMLHFSRHNSKILLLVFTSLALISCGAISPPSQVTYSISLVADGKQTDLDVPAGTTAQVAVERAGLSLNPLDRLEPAGYSVLAHGDIIRLVRVREVFEVEERSIPFENQTVKNESLPEGQTRLIQSGKNGVEQITYRQVFEDDVEVSSAVFKSVLLAEPHAEIVMVGVQKPFTALPIPGRLAYLSGGSAWVMEKSTEERRPLVTSGDLDGRVFDLSPDGSKLLFTRKSSKPPEEEINTLWMIDLDEPEAKTVDLRVANIAHYASWVPGKGLTIAYSTVEPRATAPGWQANNNLIIASYSPSGIFQEVKEIIPENTGGVYGWWGTTYAWSPDGILLAYARPDSIGLVDIENGNLQPVEEIAPYQTGADWAWVSGLSWAPTHQVLYYVDHPAKSGLENAEASPLFDFTASVMDGGPSIVLAPQSGMFAYPAASPLLPDGTYRLAYLQAIFPEQSDTGRYRLYAMDRDGSNRSLLFPPDGLPGLEPQQIVWSTEGDGDNGHWIALTYQGNLWLLNLVDGTAQQVTGDGLIKRIDW
jgi:resuscitation-promoting factor RpfB